MPQHLTTEIPYPPRQYVPEPQNTFTNPPPYVLYGLYAVALFAGGKILGNLIDKWMGRQKERRGGSNNQVNVVQPNTLTIDKDTLRSFLDALGANTRVMQQIGDRIEEFRSEQEAQSRLIQANVSVQNETITVIRLMQKKMEEMLH